MANKIENRSNFIKVHNITEDRKSNIIKLNSIIIRWSITQIHNLHEHFQ